MLATIVCLLLLYVCICCAWVLSFPESRRPICLPVLCLAPCWNTTVFVWQCTVRAASVLHDKLFHRLLLSPMRFFDTTPLGRILTRFSRDMDEGEVSCLDFILRALRSPYHPDNTVWSDIFWFSLSLCVLFSLSIHLTIHSGRPSGHACWDAAPELDHGAFMPGHGVHHIPLVPALPLAPGSFPPHCQPRLQVRLQPINLDERDYVGCMCVSVHAYVCWLKYKKCRDGLGFCRSFG